MFHHCRSRSSATVRARGSWRPAFLGLTAWVYVLHAPTESASATELTCQLSSGQAAPASSVQLDVFLQDAADVRGYQVAMTITRTSGSGEVTVACPGGISVDVGRADHVFAGFDVAGLQPDCTNCGIVAPDCADLRVAVARVSGGVNVGAAPRYLATYALDVSGDATLGSTFEIAILPFPSSILGAADNSPIPFSVGASCVLTVEEAPIPTVSAWGLVTLTLLLLTVAKVYFGRRNQGSGVRRGLVGPVALGLCLLMGRAVWAGQPCTTNPDCDDDDVCTFDHCLALSCVHSLTRHGDVAGATGCGPDGTVDEADIEAMGDGFANTFGPGCSLGNLDLESSAACVGDGVVDLFDLFAVLSAYAGTTKCPCLRPPDDVEPPTDQPCAAPCSECTACQNAAGAGGGSSLYSFSGETYHSAVDLRIPGRGLDFVWCRKYRSKIGPDSAQGHGWDFSYNVYLEPQGQDLVLYDGNTRRDTYELQPDGTWTRREFFRVLEANPDGSYTLTFADTGLWNFRPFDGSATAGKIDTIVDRNGNTLALAYDGAGRLTTVTDTLGRLISVGYNGDGLISAVTDFAGRSVTYDYYDGIEPDGGFGDLKSATTPPVAITPEFPIPPGHAYPAGKTTRYRYSAGFVDDRLNHNLLSVTDPKGQTYLVNEYHSTTNPHDLNFDRVRTQTLGNPDERIDVVYVPQVPSGANNQAVVKAIVNDRVGNVTEYLYDSDNRCVTAREYTGRGDPDQPTTETLNRPVDPLRPTDPAYFETSYEYNVDSLPTRVVHPNGGEEERTYDTSNANRRSHGNLLEQCRLPGPLGGDQTQICEPFEYDDEMGGCCGSNFVRRQVDGRGNETIHDYDVDGNRIHTQHRIPAIVEDFEYNAAGQMTKHILPDNGSGCRRVDVYEYYEPIDGFQNGFLKREVVDAVTPESCPGPHFSLTTTYEYDLAGNVVRMIDPRGHDSQSVYNQLNQVVRSISREVTDGSGVRYETDTFYDANDNVVRVDVQNRDETGAVQPNSQFTTIHEYDVLDQRVRTCTESGTHDVPPGQTTCAGLPQGEFITTETDYDANRNPIRQRSGEAVENRQPDNVTETEYDERDLVFREARGGLDPGRSTTEYDYDQNGNLTRTQHGIESNPRVTITEYDGYDRVIRTTDPMGNQTVHEYDANGNRVSARMDGELDDVPGGAGNVRMWESTHEYDAMDRVIRTDAAFFDTATQTPIGDGLSTTMTEYTDNSQVKRVLDDNNHQATMVYDPANRSRTGTDHKGNTTTYDYDANGNVVVVTEVEKSDLGNPDQPFTTITEYDNLDRAIRTVDPAGNTTEHEYDSRDNRVVTRDALRPNNPVDPGNVIRYLFDGLNRLITTIRFLTSDGTGTGGPAGTITTTHTYDDASRLTSQADDNGNTTTYEYDALDRVVRTRYADDTEHTIEYDVHDNRITMTDANGSVVNADYDLLNRQTSKLIVPGPGVAGAGNGGSTSES